MTDEKPTGRIRTFLSWNKEPEFWRGVYSNVVAALIVGIIAFTFGIILGYIKLYRQTVEGLGAIAILLIVLYIMYKVVDLVLYTIWNRLKQRFAVVRYISAYSDFFLLVVVVIIIAVAEFWPKK